ncbi:hypothetical protein PPOP_3786, partial [Paenibacillus popilliae ATCC 14706]
STFLREWRPDDDGHSSPEMIPHGKSLGLRFGAVPG